MFSASDGGSGEATGGGTRIGSGVTGAEDTYQGTKLLYWEYGTLENIWWRQVFQEDQEHQLQKWEECSDQHNGIINPACG